MRVWRHLPQFDTIAPSLNAWFKTELGRSVLAAEERLIAQSLTNCFGYHLLQLGVDSDLDIFGDCRVQRCFKAGPILPAAERGAAFVQCEFEVLPFDTDSLDVVIAHHALEFAGDPHAMLRELYRVTVPGGRVLLVGFNPWSLLGGRMIMGRWKRESVWRNHWLSASRMQDWLRLLGFAAERTAFGFHRLPLHRTACAPKASGDWVRHLPGGGIYVITAIKQVAKFIPMRPLRKRAVSVLSTLPVAKPSAAVGQRRGRAR